MVELLTGVHASHVLVEAHSRRVDVEEAHRRAAVVEGMDDSRRHGDERSRMEPDDLVAHLELELSLQAVERVDVLPVQVRAGASRLEVEHHDDELFAGDPDIRAATLSFGDVHGGGV